MSSDKSIEKNTDSTASEVHGGDNYSNNLISKGEEIKSMPSGQCEETAMAPTEPFHSDEQSNDNQLDLNHEENEAPANISKEEPIEPSLNTEDTQITERNVEEQKQETKEPDPEIDLNEPLNFEKDVTNKVEASNGQDIEKKYEAVEDSEKIYPDTKDDTNSSLGNKELAENISGDDKLSSNKYPGNETGAMATTNGNGVAINSETSPERSPQNDKQFRDSDGTATEVDLNESIEQQAAIEYGPIRAENLSPENVRKVPPIPTQITDEMDDNSSEKEVPIICTSTSPPLPPRQNAAISTSPRLPPRGEQREQPPKTKNAVPPPLEEEMKSENFRKNFEETKRSSHHHVPFTGSKSAQLESTAEINLIASRYRKTSHHLNKEGEETRESLQEGQSFLKSTYTSFLENLTEYNEVEDVNEEDREMFKIDWSFWTQVVNDFATVASNEPENLEAHVTNGIPPQIRGIIWQLMANSKSREMEDIYETLLDTECLHEATIRRDLRRTKFVAEDKMESLFKIIKVYSVYDPDVGYTQGMGFIAAPLLINCENEAESFGLMVGLMKNYGLRELFLPGMPGLMLMLYQFDRLLEEHSPSLYNRLIREGISSTMYATQWFLTFFAYKFPLEFVLRIFDIVFVEGIEVLLKFAVNLMLKNEETLVKLRFDQLLDFLKDELFNYYLMGNHDDVSVVQMELSGRDTFKGGEDSTLSYNVDLFVHDAMTGVYITPLTLRRYKGEYIEIHEKEQKKEDHYESLRIQNHQLQREAQKLEHDYSILNKENIGAANELIQNRLNMEMLLDEKNDLINTINDIKNQIEEEIRKQNLPNPDASLPKADLREDLERTISRNNEVMRENGQLEERITELQAEIDELISINKEQVSTASLLERDSKAKGRKGWTGFKKVFK
ncbi:GTPase-activating protein GYP5 [Saccharomyces paradoxus]|uniref:GTPase-activating protein GYP5 n=1 Tax=Saccharomyces paradoxus TaxID=27291 RepID=A0A8B8V0I0_SACPA|nr:Gyp5 [Saccharomyces paradoxus]QHS76493.1 Gyp5 [Saccharomyces paradoxus]